MKIRNINPLVRAIGTFGAVAAIATGATYAIGGLSSQATLNGNTVSSATASLKVWDGDSFESAGPGFTITNLVPGTGVTKNAYFQNAGGVPLDITAHVPTLPSSSGFSGWNNLTVGITAEGCNVINTDMASLNAGEVALPCNPLAAGAQGDSNTPNTPGNYDFHFDVVPASITGSQVTVGAFDLVFTGTQP